MTLLPLFCSFCLLRPFITSTFRGLSPHPSSSSSDKYNLMAHNSVSNVPDVPRELVKTSTQKKIVRAVRMRLEGIFGPAPHTLPATYREVYASVARGLRGKVDDKSLKRAFQSGAMLALWAEAERVLHDRPEPTPAQMKKILVEIEMLDFASVLRASVKNISRKIPKAPRGKRFVLDPQQQRDAVTKMREFRNREGLSQKEAYEKVAEVYGVHWRTIQNLWARTKKKETLKEE